jgi:hypothetical protein
MSGVWITGKTSPYLPLYHEEDQPFRRAPEEDASRCTRATVVPNVPELEINRIRFS